MPCTIVQSCKRRCTAVITTAGDWAPLGVCELTLIACGDSTLDLPKAKHELPIMTSFQSGPRGVHFLGWCLAERSGSELCDR